MIAFLHYAINFEITVKNFILIDKSKDHFSDIIANNNLIIIFTKKFLS